MKVKKPILLIQDNFGGLDQNQGQNPIVHCRFVGFPPLFWAKNASKSLKMPMFPYKMDTLYYYVNILSVTLFNTLEIIHKYGRMVQKLPDTVNMSQVFSCAKYTLAIIYYIHFE